jgi:hypothetical protein
MKHKHAGELVASLDSNSMENWKLMGQFDDVIEQFSAH